MRPGTAAAQNWQVGEALVPKVAGNRPGLGSVLSHRPPGFPERALRIREVRVTPVAIPLLKQLRMAIASPTVRESVVVEIRTEDGLLGIGDGMVAPYFSGETLGSAVYAVDRLLSPRLIGSSAFDIGVVVASMDAVLVGNGAAKAAIEIALHDLVGRALGVPIHQLLGGRVRQAADATWMVTAEDPQAAAEDALEGIAQGFGALKVKVGAHSPKADVARLRAIRGAVGPDVHLRPDANQAWTAREAIAVLRELEPEALQLIEQPTRRGDLAALIEVASRVAIPLALDEGVFDAEDALRHIRTGAAGGVMIKLIKSGGIKGAWRLASVLDAAGLPFQMAGMPGETSIAAAAAAHLAVAFPRLDWDCGIGVHAAAGDVVTQPLKPAGGAYRPPDGPGLGLDLDPDALARWRVEA